MGVRDVARSASDMFSLHDRAGRMTLAASLVLPTVMVVASVVMYASPVIPPVLPIFAYVAAFLGTLFFTLLDYKKMLTSDMSYALICPLSLSIFMNVFLGSMAHAVSHGVATVLLSSNILYCFVVAVGAFAIDIAQAKREPLALLTTVLLSALILYAGVLFFVFPTNPTAFLSTLRNLITPCAFLLLGAVVSKRSRTDAACDLVLLLGLIVVVFGLFEITLCRNFWGAANISDLWGLKGMNVPPGAMPNNFYSSESIGGAPMRRMSSLFADPVNLGTFLFALVVVAWYRGRKVLAVASIICCALTVSKGALMGFLIWIFVFFLEKGRNKWVKRASVVFVVFAGLGFLAYSLTNSTGSVAAHMRGFTGGIASMLQNPFGYGCGNVGVLAGLANEEVLRSVEESGFGVIAGEVGVLGVAVYTVLFAVILRWSLARTEGNVRIFLITLLLAIYANVIFNEVALSPNSCGIYFSLLGIFLASPEMSPAAYEPRHLRCP